MDKKQTFGNNQELKEILDSCFVNNTDVHLLIDVVGLERAFGQIIAVGLSDKKGAYIRLNDSSLSTFLLKDIVAVNGVFRSDYSEC